MKGFGGGIIGAVITFTALLGGLIGVVTGKRNKLPDTSVEAAENYVTNDDTTTAVTIEDELDVDLYTDPGNDDTLHDDFVHEETILAIEHDHNVDQETRSQTDGDNNRRLLIVL